MTSNDPDLSEVEPNSLLEQINEDGQPITYACEYHTGRDPLRTSMYAAVPVEQFYDLVYPCQSNSADKYGITSDIAETLLSEAALLWGILPEGAACTDPESRVYGAWLFGVSSMGPDEFVTDFGCQRLTPNTTLKECCQVVRSEMQFIPTGNFNISSLQLFMRERLNSGEASQQPLTVRTAAIDPPFAEVQASTNDESVRDNLDEPIRVTGDEIKDPSQSTQTHQSTNREITATGGFVIAMIVASCFGAFFLMYRSIRKKRGLTWVAGRKDDDYCDSTMDQGPSCEDIDCHVTVVKERDQSMDVSRQFFSASSASEFAKTEPKNIDLLMFDLPLDDDYPPAKYTFDLSDAFKQDVMGTYAPTTMQVVAPYPMLEDTSCDSEVDSWAQTDGTVGSLEDRLEEITAEI